MRKKWKLIHWSYCLSVCPSVRPSVRPSASLSVCLPAWLAGYWIQLSSLQNCNSTQLHGSIPLNVLAYACLAIFSSTTLRVTVRSIMCHSGSFVYIRSWVLQYFTITSAMVIYVSKLPWIPACFWKWKVLKRSTSLSRNPNSPLERIRIFLAWRNQTPHRGVLPVLSSICVYFKNVPKSKKCVNIVAIENAKKKNY